MNTYLLIEKLYNGERTFYSIPGGGIEDGETPEDAAIRELKEECGLNGKVVKKLAIVYNEKGTEHSFLLSVPDSENPIIGNDPEEPSDKQSIKDVLWMSLDELPEKDRAVLCTYGLFMIDGFFDEALTWGDEISYPKKK